MSISREQERISRFMAYILRHDPKKFNVEMDRRGFVKIKQLLEVLNTKYPDLGREKLIYIVKNSPKVRYEIKEENIRARYGHSVDVDLELEPVEPPQLLYHGTSRKNAATIRQSGLKPMNRRYVHLSVTVNDALEVGIRHDKNPVILRIRALQAYNDGIVFYRSGPVFLTQQVAYRYIE